MKASRRGFLKLLGLAAGAATLPQQREEPQKTAQAAPLAVRTARPNFREMLEAELREMARRNGWTIEGFSFQPGSPDWKDFPFCKAATGVLLHKDRGTCFALGFTDLMASRCRWEDAHKLACDLERHLTTRKTLG